jgi:hypothetical protein
MAEDRSPERLLSEDSTPEMSQVAIDAESQTTTICCSLAEEKLEVDVCGSGSRRCASAELNYLISGIKNYRIIGIFLSLRIAYIGIVIGSRGSALVDLSLF